MLQPSGTVAPADLRSISHRTGETVAKLPLTLRLHSSFTTDSLDLPHRWLTGFGQIDLASVVLSFHFVLNLLEHLADCGFHVLLCHQACAQLLGYDQRERHGCMLRLCRLRCGCRLRSLSRSAGLCFCCSCSALCCLDSSCSLRCVTFYH